MAAWAAVPPLPGGLVGSVEGEASSEGPGGAALGKEVEPAEMEKEKKEAEKHMAELKEDEQDIKEGINKMRDNLEQMTAEIQQQRDDVDTIRHLF